MDHGDGPTRPQPGPLFAEARDPTSQEAVVRLVQFVEESPAGDEVAAAARVVLRDLKAQAQVGIRLEAIVHEVVKILEGVKP